MRVRCVKLLDYHGNEDQENWAIKVGDERVVFAVELDPERGPLFRVETPNTSRSTILLPAQMFEVLDGRLPRSWRIGVCEDGRIVIEPAAWREKDFWERYIDLDPMAKAVFEAAKAEILEESES